MEESPGWKKLKRWANDFNKREMIEPRARPEPQKIDDDWCRQAPEGWKPSKGTQKKSI